MTRTGAAATLVSIPGGHLANRHGASRVLIGDVACYIAAYVGFAFAGPSIAPLALSFVAAGVGIGFVETTQHSAVAGLAPVAFRGSAFGLLAALQSIGQDQMRWLARVTRREDLHEDH